MTYASPAPLSLRGKMMTGDRAKPSVMACAHFDCEPSKKKWSAGAQIFFI